MADAPSQIVAAKVRPGGLTKGDTRTEANARLTSIAGALLFLLLAVQGVTILRIHQLVTAHVVVGFALLGPLAVKLGSTGWRFARYYARDADYRRAGPPHPLLRVLAPFLVLTTVVVFASGVALLAVRPGRGSTLLVVHKVSFVLWFGVTTVHVLAYLAPAARWSFADITGRGPAAVLASRPARYLLMGAGLIAGAALGVVSIAWAHPWVTWFATGQGGNR